MKFKTLSTLAACTLVLVACQPQAVLPVRVLQTAAPIPFQSRVQAPALQPGAYRSPVLTSAQLEITGEIQVSRQQVSVKVQLPPQAGDFRTQALHLGAATTISASVSDSHGVSYLPVGADGDGRVSYPGNGILELSFENVVPDPLLFVNLQVHDATAEIPQAELAAVLSHTGTANASTSLNFQTTPAAQAMGALLAANASRARSIDLAALASLMQTITGFAAGPPVSYGTHPSLVNTAQLANDLLAQNPDALTAADYRRVGAMVSVDVLGLVGDDTLDLQITDAASAIASGLGNGNDQLLSPATPGNGLAVRVGFGAGNSTQYTFVASPSQLNLSEGGTTDLVVTATPVAIALDSLTPNAGLIGSTVVLSGANFSTVAANNLVRFGSTPATVTAASATELTVTVPPALAGEQAVTVQVGATTSAALAYQVRPAITGFSVGHGSTGDQIVISGTGFSSTAANNTVRFGTMTATVDAASPTELTVTLNEAPAGAVNATVQVGTQTSADASFNLRPRLTALTTQATVDDKAVLIRSQNLTLSGSNFDNTPGHHSVRFTLADSSTVDVTPSSASPTQLVLTVPPEVVQAGNVGVQVTSHGQVSNSLTGWVPVVNLEVNHGGFH